jgi:hypothetical protein
MPPVPTTVIRRLLGSSRLISTRSRSRPMNEVSACGRFDCPASLSPRASPAARTGPTIAALGQRFDPALGARRLRQHAANRVHLRRQVAFLDDHVRPRELDTTSSRRTGARARPAPSARRGRARRASSAHRRASIGRIRRRHETVRCHGCRPLPTVLAISADRRRGPSPNPGGAIPKHRALWTIYRDLREFSRRDRRVGEDFAHFL